QRAADPRPLARQRDDHDAVAAVVREVLAGLAQKVGAGLREPVGPIVLGVAGRLTGEAGRREQRRAYELLAPAARTLGERVLCGQRHDVVAGLALERTDAGQRARVKWLHRSLRWQGPPVRRKAILPARSISRLRAGAPAGAA